MAESSVSRSRVRTFLSNAAKPKRLGRPPFFTPEEETLLAKYVRVQAMIGMGLTPLAFRRKCAEYIDTLSAARRAAAAAYFGGTTIPGKSFVSSSLVVGPSLSATEWAPSRWAGHKIHAPMWWLGGSPR
mgnify:CR=1 FL=1